MADTGTCRRFGYELHVCLQQPSCCNMVCEKKRSCCWHYSIRSKYRYVFPCAEAKLFRFLHFALTAGLIYPVMFKFLVAQEGFPIAVRYLAILVGCTSFIAFLCARPDPAATLRVPEKWLKSEVWIDVSAFHHRSYTWFVAAMCFIFLGFYPVFFNLEGWAQWKGVGIKEDIAGGTGVLVGEDGFRTFYFLSISNGCSTIGRILGAYLCDQ